MKTLKKDILLLTSFVMAMSAASCVNNELTEPEEGLAVKELATIDAQVASMEATLADLEALQTSAEGLDEELASVVSSIENHIADLKAGATLLDGTLATLERQKELAEVMAAIEFGAEATKGGAALTKAVASVDKRAESWLGKHFAAYYPAAKAEAAAAARLAALDLKTQKISVEAILSDVEAGLRKNADKEELTALAAKIDSNADEVAELLAALTETRTEVETEYAETVETAVTDPSGFDLPALKQFNSAVAGTLAEADNSLAGLIARVEACEAQLEDIKTRLGDLENTVTDLNELLDLIQSVTFMSEYSAENAIAYYTLGSESRADGKKLRNPQGTIDLSYVIRPASAALALTSPELWDNEVKVFGYYAQTITKAAPETFDFDITNVTADESGNGIVTVTVSAVSLNESFYFKETGAKLALSIATGKTDLTSKFVEIVPKDKSGKVYVEAIELSAKSIEIDNGSTADIDAFVTPSNVTEGGVIWTTSDASVLTVSNDGVVEGKSVGTAVVTATTNGTDEWGNTISARCTVKVNPAIRLKGPDYVEEGGEVELRLESPNYINPDLVKWSLADENLASIVTVADGVVKGVKMYYDMSSKAYIPVTIVCKIDDSTQLELTHEIRVVAPQPAGLDVATVGTAGSHTVKVGEGFSLATAVKPDNVSCGNFSSSDTQFRLRYTSNNTSVANVNENGYISTSNPGTAYIDIEVHSNNTYSYWYPAGKSLKRQIQVNVLPYYVKGISFTESGNAFDGIFELSAGGSTTVATVLTSDKDGHEPTYQDVTWSSSDSDIVSVNQNGQITAADDAGGKTATITVTTSNPSATEDGSTVSASFVVSVVQPWLSFEIGDYVVRKSDGSIAFASSLSDVNSADTIVGVVFTKNNPRSTDTRLPETCVHGIALGLLEIASGFWWNGYPSSGYQSVQAFAVANGFVSTIGAGYSGGIYVTDIGKQAYGYNNTKAFVDYLTYCKTNEYKVKKADDSSNYEVYYIDVESNLITSLSNMNEALPNEVSEWYLPSVYEMLLISENHEILNGKLSNAGGYQIANEAYWTVSENTSPSAYAVTVHGQTGEVNNMASKSSSSYKTRYVFAF